MSACAGTRWTRWRRGRYLEGRFVAIPPSSIGISMAYIRDTAWLARKIHTESALGAAGLEAVGRAA
jgi:hypothetical protein